MGCAPAEVIPLNLTRIHFIGSCGMTYSIYKMENRSVGVRWIAQLQRTVVNHVEQVRGRLTVPL